MFHHIPSFVFLAMIVIHIWEFILLTIYFQRPLNVFFWGATRSTRSIGVRTARLAESTSQDFLFHEEHFSFAIAAHSLASLSS